MTTRGLSLFQGLLTAACAAAALLPTTCVAQLYVDENAAGPVHDGTTWCTAFLRLEEALAVASPGEIIRVADGVYVPDSGGLADPRSATFDLPSDVTVFGGFPGCGAELPDLWNPFDNPVTLSGDLAGDDPAGTSDNAYHVLTATTSGDPVVLIGLNVTGGRADGTEQDALGGGLFAFGPQVNMRLVHFWDNEAWRGAAVYAEGGALSFDQCAIESNHASGEGGAVYHTSSLEAKDCLFALNTAVSDGGAIFSDLAYLRLLGCTVAGNVSGSRGGGIYEYVGVDGNVLNSIVWGNADMSGSGEEAQLFINPSNSMRVDYSCVQGWSGTFEGEGNIGDDPLFLSSGAGDFRLAESSPCLDTGNTDLVETQRDLDDNPRIWVEVDMGCYERPAPASAPTQTPTSGDVAELAGIAGARPIGGGLEFHLRLPSGTEGAAIRLHDASGRLVNHLTVSASSSDEPTVRWDGIDSFGRRVPSGVYFVSLVVVGEVMDTKKAAWVR